VLHFGSDLDESFWGAGIAFVTVAVVSAIVTFLTTPKKLSELRGLVYGVDPFDSGGTTAWYRSPVVLGTGALALAAAFYLPFL
jgi:SSS family solute:Na+ symporter